MLIPVFAKIQCQMEQDIYPRKLLWEFFHCHFPITADIRSKWFDLSIQSEELRCNGNSRVEATKSIFSPQACRIVELKSLPQKVCTFLTGTSSMSNTSGKGNRFVVHLT
jgi:hypothetical protein